VEQTACLLILKVKFVLVSTRNLCWCLPNILIYTTHRGVHQTEKSDERRTLYFARKRSLHTADNLLQMAILLRTNTYVHKDKFAQAEHMASYPMAKAIHSLISEITKFVTLLPLFALACKNSNQRQSITMDDANSQVAVGAVGMLSLFGMNLARCLVFSLSFCLLVQRENYTSVDVWHAGVDVWMSLRV